MHRYSWKNSLTIIFEIMKKENSTNTSSLDTFIRCQFKKPSLFRSSRPEVFCEKGVLRNIATFTGRHLCQSLLFDKKETLGQVFPVNFVKFLRTPFLIEHLWWLFLFIDGTIPLYNFEFRKKYVRLLRKDFFSRSFFSKFFHKMVSEVKNET